VLGACSGGAATTSPDVLTFAPPAGGFTLPGSTGGSITYTVPALAANAVFATGSSPTVYEANQTLAVSAVTTVPVMVSATATGTVGGAGTITITYNEPVACPAASDFTYIYTGVAAGTITSCAGSPTADTLTLGFTNFQAPTSSATITYTAPTTNSTTASVYASGSLSPVLYAATQTLSGAMWIAPAMTSAVVDAAGTGLAVVYNEPVSCPGTAAASTVFAYDSVGTTSGGAISTCSGAGTTASPLILGVTGLVLPSAGASLIYTAPSAGSTAATAVSSTSYPQFPATQTQALTVAAAPTMVSAVVSAGTPGSIAITYSGDVSCPTAAYSDFAYYSTGTTSGLGTGTIAAVCTASSDVLTLTDTGAVTAPVGTTGSVVYTAPATNSLTASVSAYQTSVFAATQTLALEGVPVMVSAVVTPGTSIAVTYNEAVFCPTTFAAGNFTYQYTIGFSGGTVTGCAASGDVLTLSGAFNTPAGSAQLTYNSLGGGTAGEVFAGSLTAPIYEVNGNFIAGSVITG